MDLWICGFVDWCEPEPVRENASRFASSTSLISQPFIFLHCQHCKHSLVNLHNSIIAGAFLCINSSHSVLHAETFSDIELAILLMTCFAFYPDHEAPPSLNLRFVSMFTIITTATISIVTILLLIELKRWLISGGLPTSPHCHRPTNLHSTLLTAQL